VELAALAAEVSGGGVFDGWDDGDLREVVCSWKNTVAKNEPNQKAISKARSNLGKIGEK